MRGLSGRAILPDLPLQQSPLSVTFASTCITSVNTNYDAPIYFQHLSFIIRTRIIDTAFEKKNLFIPRINRDYAKGKSSTT